MYRVYKLTGWDGAGTTGRRHVADFVEEEEAIVYCRQYASDHLNWGMDYQIIPLTEG